MAWVSDLISTSFLQFLNTNRVHGSIQGCWVQFHNAASNEEKALLNARKALMLALSYFFYVPFPSSSMIIVCITYFIEGHCSICLHPG